MLAASVRNRFPLMAVGATMCLLVGSVSMPVRAGAAAHIFVPLSARAGALPCRPGTGWSVDFFYDIPNEEAGNLLDAERYLADNKIQPTFTFHADYLDWPAGPQAYGFDEEFDTLGDFLNGHISDVSDPDALDLPFDKHFLLRAGGYLKVRLADSDPIFNEPPRVSMDFGLASFDGSRLRIQLSIFRIILPPEPDGFFFENPIFAAPGAYPMEVTYFQKYDTNPEERWHRAGFEMYSCLPGGLELPGADLLPCPEGWVASGIPTEFIYPWEDVLPITPGDFDADTDVDLEDWSWLQRCFTGPEFEGRLPYACEFLDLDADGDVDLDDDEAMMKQFGGPDGC